MAELRSAGPPFGRRAGDPRGCWSQTWAVLRVVAVVGGVIAAVWLIYELRSVLLLLVLSVFFAYLLAPLVSLFTRPFRVRGVERQLSAAAAIGVVYVLLFGLLTVTSAWLLPRFSQQVTQIASQAPAYVQAVQGGGQSVTRDLDRLGLPANAREAINRTLVSLLGSMEAAARASVSAVVGLFGYLPWLVLIPILGFFLLKDAESFREATISLLPARMRLDAAQLIARVNVAIAAYIRAQLIACLLIGVVVGVGFALLGVPYPVILGVLAGLAEFVPLVGPLVVAVIAALIAGIHAPVLAVWVLVFLGIVRIAEDYVVYPRLVGHGVHLHPLAIIVAVLAGAELAGVPGIFLAVPTVAVLSAAYRQFASRSRGEQAGGTLELPRGGSRTA